MRKLTIMVVWVGVLVAGTARGDGSSLPCVCLLSSLGVETNLANRCFSFVSANVPGLVRQNRSLLPLEGLSPKEQLEAISEIRSDGDVLVVALVAPKASEAASAVIFSKQLKCSVVNTAKLTHSEGPSCMRSQWRVDRAALFSLGRLVGVDVCPNPQCALSDYQQDPTASALGRNYCPPCHDRVAHALALLGVSEPEDADRKFGADRPKSETGPGN